MDEDAERAWAHLRSRAETELAYVRGPVGSVHALQLVVVPSFAGTVAYDVFWGPKRGAVVRTRWDELRDSTRVEHPEGRRLFGQSFPMLCHTEVAVVATVVKRWCELLETAPLPPRRGDLPTPVFADGTRLKVRWRAGLGSFAIEWQEGAAPTEWTALVDATGVVRAELEALSWPT